MKSAGLQHAASLGNIEVLTQNHVHNSGRSYDSEDEIMGRKKNLPSSTGLFPRTSIYSKGDIREQYCLSDRQLSSIERPRRDRFFGCLSGRGAPQSFLGVCVGRRAPSDENLAPDYAPFYKYPRYPNQSNDLIQYDDDLESSYFRRRPTSCLNTGDAKRYTWMPADEEAVRLEGPRSICPDEYDDRGPYVVGSYPPRSYLSQSSEHLARVYRCPAHVGLPPPPPPPVLADGITNAPREKRVSFARSHTLTSFDEAVVGRSISRMNTTRSQERLIGCKKPLPSAITHSIMHQQPLGIHAPLTSVTSVPEIVVVEKTKRLTMKAQATQTEVCLGRKAVPIQHLSLSPRTIHRVKMVSQGAQTNGGLNGRKLTKSLSEMTNARNLNVNFIESGIQTDELKLSCEHEPLHRTQSEEPPRSPFEINQPKQSNYYQFDMPTRTSSRQSETEASKSDVLSSQNMFSHSRNLSHDSANSYKSADVSTSRASHDFSSSNFLSESLASHSDSRGTVAEASSTNESDQCYETNSLPRQKCIHHKMEFHTYSLPRKDPHLRNYNNELYSQVQYAEIISGTNRLNQKRTSISRDSSTDSNHPEFGTNENIVAYRRPSYPSDLPEAQNVSRRPSAVIPCTTEEQNSASDEFCSTCESESDSRQDQEKEIFIDFKPRLSNNSSPRSRKKRLQKTLSEGEILFDQKKAIDGIVMASASEEDLKMSGDNDANQYMYRNAPIKDEGICDKNNLLKLPEDGVDSTVRNKREAFRKRSISLEDPSINDDYDKSVTLVKSLPPSPGLDDLSVRNHSTYPSTDSLANDITRDHSDGIWNESQATVLQAESTPQNSTPALLTPTTKRKNLLLQHQQRSSMDTDALELEDHFSDLSVPSSTHTSKQQTSNAQTTSSIKTSQVTPSIAVTPSLSIELEDHKVPIQTIQRRSRPSSPTKRKEIRRRSAFGQDIDPSIHTCSNISNESPDHAITSATSELLLNRSDSGKNTDLSECSTNTEDYVTCTDNSRRVPGIKTASASSSSTTQVPASAQTSQTVTQDGSSFESASSMYSLARVDAICEDGGVLDDNTPLPPIPSQNTVKSSPSHSAASSSSAGSYCPNGLKKSVKTSSPTRTNIVKPILTKPKTESVSDDDKSEKRYSSSGYYESPQDEDNKPSRQRRVRDWNEEDRRRRKEKMRLDIEKENMKSLTSPIKKPSHIFKQISPDDRAAMNILDGTSPNKAKRLRPKTRRSPRIRSSNEEFFGKRVKTPIVINSEADSAADPVAEIVPSKNSHPCRLSPRNIKDSSPDKGLKALSTESLRSASPGSDSVFYSEADALVDHQVHCQNCGKQVEIVNAASGSQETLGGSVVEEIVPTIVKPPADFADSPDGPRTPHHTTRLYKKLDKRFRSEERHGDRRIYRTRQESARAKSEERGKDEANERAVLRPAGSSPCVVLPEGQRDQQSEPEQRIYLGHYRLGFWICVTGRNVWKKHDVGVMEERSQEAMQRRGSTDSEKDFRKRYQAITHRLVHRRSCVEMQRRQSSNSFSTDKSIILYSGNGEFGFRIHGSKPVVVSAIEPDTPAETSGLEIGDIVLFVNGISVIDKTHSEVVQIAHAGSDVLKIEVARTANLISNDATEAVIPALYSGYLWRQGPNNQKWVRRWFCLRPDNCLYFYKTEGDVLPVGAVRLAGNTVENCSSGIGRPFAFQISSGENLPLYLAADSEEAANRWIAVTSHSAKQSDPWLELSTRTLRLPPNGVPRPDCFGYLMKLGTRWRVWSKRYCVLKDACLYFYHDGNSKNAFGMACLQGHRVIHTNNSLGKKFAFEIAPLETKLRHYFFSTESEMDKKRWLAALEYSIDRWMKAG